MLDSRVLLLVFAEKRTTAMTLARLTSCRHDDSRNTVSYMSVCSSFLRFHQPRFVCDHMTSSDFDALTAHLTALQEPSWPPLRGHRLAMQGIAERMEMLYRDLQWWTELDLRLKDVDWSASGISRWPLDVWCVFSSAQDLCLVGNVNTASRLEDVGRIYGLRVTVVVSMLQPREMKTRGAPSDWATYFAEQSMCHVQRPLDVGVARTGQQPLYAQQCISAWLKVCRDLWQHKMSMRPSEPFVVLFHCFGGRNKGPAMACAWLIVAYGFSTDEAVEYIVWERRGIWPWRRREYILWAFKILEDAREDIVQYFQTNLRAL